MVKTSDYPPKEVIVRPLRKRDMPAMLKIEMETFGAPASEGEFAELRGQRGFVQLVAEYKNEVVGFVCFILEQHRCTILQFAVARCHRRHGVGSLLVEEVIRYAQKPQIKKLALVLGDNNLIGQLFFSSQGFLCTKVLRDYFPDSYEDGYVMMFYLKDPPPAPTKKNFSPTNRITRFNEQRGN